MLECIDDGAAPRFSVVVPAHNEEDFLPGLLDSLAVAMERYGGVGAFEVIVADNASTDATAAVAAVRSCRVVRVEKRAIGAARNGGAAEARGEVLAFVDADTRVHPDTFLAIDAALATGRVIGGATGVSLDRWSLPIALTYALVVPLLWFTGFDTGVVFCRRASFAAIGGYDEHLLAAEDVQFLVALRRLGRAHGQRLVRLRRAKAIASTRKFDRHGDWHYLAMLARGPLLILLAPRRWERFARRYWYDDQRPPESRQTREDPPD